MKPDAPAKAGPAPRRPRPMATAVVQVRQLFFALNVRNQHANTDARLSPAPHDIVVVVVSGFITKKTLENFTKRQRKVRSGGRSGDLVERVSLIARRQW